MGLFRAAFSRGGSTVTQLFLLFSDLQFLNEIARLQQLLRVSSLQQYRLVVHRLLLVLHTAAVYRPAQADFLL